MYKSKQKIFSLIIAISMIAALFLPLTTYAEDSTKKIDILSITDLHGALTKSGKNIGIASLVNEVKKAKTANPNTIFVSAGDLFQGSAESNLLYGKPVAETLKEAGVVVSALGNHEFDWGTAKFSAWEKDGGFEFLGANLYDTTTNQPVSYAKPYKIVEIDGVKVAFIGLSTPETAYKTKPENVKNVEFKNPADVLPKYIKEVKDNGANIVIALTHLGANADKNGIITGEAADIAKIEGIDGIIAGHYHLQISGKVDNVPFVMPYYNGRSVGKLSYTVDTTTKKVVSSTVELDNLFLRQDTLAEDAATKAIYDKYMAQVQPVLSEKLGIANVELSHEGKKSTIMGEWVSDIMRIKANVQIAFQNGGGLRTSLPKGDLTVGSMYTLMPFDNTLVTAKLTGAQVREVIENGIDNPKISFGQAAGVYVEYDLSKPFGQRIVKITLENGEPIVADKYYTVVANDFMFEGGDGYVTLKQGKDIVNTGVPIRDALVDYVKEKKVIEPAYKGYQKEYVAPKPVVPVQVAEPVKPVIKEVVYIVKPGDVLWRIAKTFGMPYQRIGEYNKLKNMNLIFPGQKLLIPQN